MPALPNVPQVLRVIQRQSYSGDADIVNRYFFHYGGTAPTLTDLTTFGGAIDSSWGSHLASVTANGLGVDDWEITDLTSPTSPQVTVASAQFGTDSDTPLPASIAAVVGELIERRYRGGRPRVYLAGRTESQLSTPGAVTWSSAFLTALETAFAAFMSGIGAGVWSGGGPLLPVNVSFFEGFTNVLYPSGRYHAVPTRRVTPVVDDVLGWRVNPHLGSQRRRNLSTA